MLLILSGIYAMIHQGGYLSYTVKDGHLLTFILYFIFTVKPVFRGNAWYEEKVAF